MEIRNASSTDSEEIATVARASLSESYGHFINQESIVDIVEEWYNEGQLDELLDDENVVFLLARDDETIVGYVQGAIVQGDPPAGEIDWLHVAPQFRGQNIGTQLLGRMQDALETLGAHVLRGKVLTRNEDGGAFYEEHGFERVDTRAVTIEDTEYEEGIFEKVIEDRQPSEVVESVEGPDGQELFVSFSDAERGAKGPFYTVFESESLQDKYGFYCGNCDSINTAMDPMGRIACNRCENQRKATRWDASYL